MNRLSVGHVSEFLWRFARLNSLSITVTSRKYNNTMENLKANPYYEKYAKRITELQQSSPEEYQRRIDSTSSNKTKQPPSSASGTVDTRQYSSVLNPKEFISEKLTGKEKKLDDILKTELVRDKDSGEIQNIWEQYHRNKEVISATIPSDVYTLMQQLLHKSPTFLFPLPRSQGYEFILCQNQRHTVHFTPLLAYQVHKENAPECLTVVHYTELQEKGIVLMRGEYDKNVLTGQEAQCLANQFQMYYSGKDPVKMKLLETFTTTPNSFKHMDLIKEMENIVLV